MDTGTIVFLVFAGAFIWVSWRISVAYKKRFNRNILVTKTSVGVLASQFFMALAYGGIKFKDPDSSAAQTFQTYVSPGFFYFGIFILVVCLIRNVRNANPAWGAGQTVFQFIYTALLNVILLTRIMAGADKSVKELYTEPLVPKGS